MSFTQKVSRVRVVGTSEAIQRVEGAALEIARGDAHVLITGERGVGKAVMARFIHERSRRSLQRFAMLKCAGLPDLLVESELFGHTEGSFDGAYRDKPGLLTSVVGGTVFLDDVGTLSTKMQTRLLRFLETSETVHIGVDTIEVRRDVRVIASTTLDLKARVAAGLFRADLYDRLAVMSLSVPPLRERRDDIPSLVDHFIEQFVGGGAPLQSVTPPIPTDISSEVYDALSRADWPGNVRELKNVVLRQLLSATAGPSGTSMLRTA